MKPGAVLRRRRIARQTLLGGLACLGLTMGADCWEPSEDAFPRGRKPPNILFVMADDHAIQAVGAHGGNLNHTPQIDRIAEEGMLFRHALVTNSICSPSRATLLTGTYSHVNGQFTNWEIFDGEQTTFPKLLRARGYHTALIGKWHLHSDPTGFEDWEVLSALLGQGTYYDPAFKTPEGRVVREGYTTDVVTDRALEWLENTRDPSRPFLLMVQHKAPHRAWLPGPEQLTTFDDVTFPEPPTLFDDYSGRASPASQQTMEIARDLTPVDLKLVRPPFLPESYWQSWDAAYEAENAAFEAANLEGDELVRWKYQRYVKDYLRTIESVDENVGRLLDYLDQSGLAENTVVVYTSDQGFYLGEHGWFDKRWMYEESLHTPLLVRWPGHTAAGSVNSHLVSNLDLAPTLIDLAGAEIPAAMQGRSLRPLLEADSDTDSDSSSDSDWRRSFYYHYFDYDAPPLTFHNVQRHYGVRTERYKLIHYYLIDEWELFDLERDPLELRSAHADPAYAQVVRELEEELERLRALYRVPEDPGAGFLPDRVDPAPTPTAMPTPAPPSAKKVKKFKKAKTLTSKKKLKKSKS